MRHEDQLKIIYWEAYNKASLAKIKSNGKKGLPTRHGAGLRAVWNAAMEAVGRPVAPPPNDVRADITNEDVK